MSSSAREDPADETKVDELDEAAVEAETGQSRRSLSFQLRSQEALSPSALRYSSLTILFFSLSFSLFSSPVAPVADPPKRKRGRPPGSKNKKTLAAQAAAAAAAGPSGAGSSTDTPKRGRGRPPKVRYF